MPTIKPFDKLTDQIVRARAIVLMDGPKLPDSLYLGRSEMNVFRLGTLSSDMIYDPPVPQMKFMDLNVFEVVAPSHLKVF